MLNRDQIAHEYILSGVATTVHSAFQLADAMIAEAQKRKSTERPSVVDNGWISVKDQLPHDTQHVLIYVEKIGINSATYHEPYFGDAEKWLGWFSDEVPTPDVTHWQPLPQAPK